MSTQETSENIRLGCQAGEPGTETRVAGNSDYSRIAPRVCRRWPRGTKWAVHGSNGEAQLAWFASARSFRTEGLGAS